MSQFYNFSGANYVYSNGNVKALVEPHGGRAVKYHVHLFDQRVQVFDGQSQVCLTTVAAERGDFLQFELVDVLKYLRVSKTSETNDTILSEIIFKIANLPAC